MTEPRTKSRARLYVAIFGILSVFLVVVFYRAFGTDPHAVPFMLAGRPAPDFKLQTLDGRSITLADFRGKPLVINFWATWCGPCKVEHPVINWGSQRFGNDVAFIGVVFEDTEANARAFIAENPTPYPLVVDPKGSMAVDYGVTGVPETYFIDREGVIRGKYANPISPKILDARVQELIAMKAAAAVNP